MSTSLQALLDSTRDWPLLDAAGERVLAQRIEQGREAKAAIDDGVDDPELPTLVADGEAARHAFVMSNLRLVVTFARRVPPPPGMDIDDLVQDGIVGLDHAVEKFDWRRGYKFSTYATWWIRQAISRAADERGTLIRIPTDRASNLRATLRQVDGDADQLDDTLGRLYWLAHPVSLDQPAGSDDRSASLADFQTGDVDPVDQIVVGQTMSDLSAAIARLDPLQRSAVILRFGIDGSGHRTYDEVGRELDMGGESARRLVRRAIRRLHDELASTDAA